MDLRVSGVMRQESLDCAYLQIKQGRLEHTWIVIPQEQIKWKASSPRLCGIAYRDRSKTIVSKITMITSAYGATQ